MLGGKGQGQGDRAAKEQVRGTERPPTHTAVVCVKRKGQKSRKVYNAESAVLGDWKKKGQGSGKVKRGCVFYSA